MLNNNDLQQIAKRGITEEQVNHQLEQFKTGFPFLRLEAAASVGNGVLAPSAEERQRYIDRWNQYKAEGHQIVKFVPASGAASRMFKDMFAFVDAPYDEPQTAFEREYFDGIKKFAFREALCDKCRENEGKSIRELLLCH